LFTQNCDEHADLSEQDKNAAATAQQAVESTPNRTESVSERHRVQLLGYRRVDKCRHIYACDVLESIARVMVLDKVIEGKIKPPIYPFEQALRERASHSAACQLDHRTSIQFPVIDGSLYLCSELEDVKTSLEYQAYQTQKIRGKPRS
jgi:hypothetical protein